MDCKLKVAVRVRPLSAREGEVKWTVEENSIIPKTSMQTPKYHFDHVFDMRSTNRDVFSIVAEPLVRHCLNGFNGTIFAYGQTSSGKTHTMLGNDIDPGIAMLAVRQLFEEKESDRTFVIRVGYIEIYNEKVYDLLDERQPVKVNQNGDKDVRLTNKEMIVSDVETVLDLLAQGSQLRMAAKTKMNDLSSRSHAIFRIIIESEDANGIGPVRVSFLNLVDLAGSEKASDTNNGIRLKEGTEINKSLLQLGIVIRALSEGQTFVDVRSSQLTRILQASLGGNANAAVVCNITPAAIEETASTLGFAMQAKRVKNKVKCNEIYTSEGVVLRQLKAELVRLKKELQISEERAMELKQEIATKEVSFLSGKNLQISMKDRRRTWPISKLPKSTSIEVHHEQQQKYIDGEIAPNSIKSVVDTGLKVVEGSKSRVNALPVERNNLETKTSEEGHQESVCFKQTIVNLESRLLSITEERNVLRLQMDERDENISSNSKIIRDLERKLEISVEEKNVLESENSELSSQVIDYYEELNDLIFKLDSIENLQTELHDAEKSHNDTLQAIEGTDCKDDVAKIDTCDVAKQLHEKQQQVDCYETDICKLRSELSEMKINMQEEKRKFGAKLIDAHQKLALKSEILNRQHRKVDPLENENKDLKKELYQMKSDIERLQKEVRDYETELDKAKKCCIEKASEFELEREEFKKKVAKYKELALIYRDDVKKMKSKLEEKAPVN